MTERIELGQNSWLECGRLPDELTYDFETLWNLHPAEFGQIKIMSRYIDTPRWQQSYEKPYRYSGMLHQALPLPAEFIPFYDYARTMYPFNQVLINWYENGHHYIGPHSDDTRQLEADSPIFSISLGTNERVFRIRDKATKKVVLDMPMPDRTYLIMCGETQNHFTHEVPKINGKKGENVGRRINITFRIFR